MFKDALKRTCLVLSQSHLYVEGTGRIPRVDDGWVCERWIRGRVGSRAEGITTPDRVRHRTAKSEILYSPNRWLVKLTAGTARRNSEVTVVPLKQSEKGFIASASRIAALHVRTERESARKGCMVSLGCFSAQGLSRLTPAESFLYFHSDGETARHREAEKSLPRECFSLVPFL